jgi:RsiW-degrading membrane proteinase PrsW (M82 family)
VLLAAVLALLPAAWFVDLLAATPPLILLAATLPAAGWACLLLLVPEPERRPRQVLLATFLSGAVVAAFVSSVLNDRLLLWIAGLAGERQARALTPLLAGPAVEELAKGAALVLVLLCWPGAQGSVLDGMVCGALVGVGFAATENLTYLALAAVQGGPGGLARAVYSRALLGGATHAVFTAASGAGLAWGRQARAPAGRIAAPLVGLVAAVVQHVAWNAIGSEAIAATLCNPAVPGGPCRDAPDALGLFVTTPLIVAGLLGPGVVALLAVARQRRARP